MTREIKFGFGLLAVFLLAIGCNQTRSVLLRPGCQSGTYLLETVTPQGVEVLKSIPGASFTENVCIKVAVSKLQNMYARCEGSSAQTPAQLGHFDPDTCEVE